MPAAPCRRSLSLNQARQSRGNPAELPSPLSSLRAH